MTEGTDSDRANFDLEIYKQKYEVFRHFDNLRWHVPTICISAGSILLAFASKKDQTSAWWAFVIFGFLSLFSAFSIYRVRKGIHQNHGALVTIAKKIGDTNIPTLKKKGGATWWLSIILLIIGIAAIIAGIIRL
jgi:phosphatidylglycerophosphate synthase